MDGVIEQENIPVQEDCLSGGGEMGVLMRSLDWSATPLGSVENWSQSLCTAVSICLSSRFPMLIWWGTELVMLYNDAYRPILGTTKHPQAMGQCGRNCWPEIWDVIGPMLQGVMATGQSTWSDDQLLLLDRNGYVEECYFTFSYSPIRDEAGKVGGVFTAVTETTQRVLGERRLSTLRDLANCTVGAKTVQEACETTAKSLANNPADIPYGLIYRLNPDKKQAHLVCTTGLNPETLLIPKNFDFLEAQATLPIWPLARVASTGEPEQVNRLRARLACEMPHIPSNFPDSALVLPIAQANQDCPAGLLVVGISPRRELDEDYRSFFELVAGQVATAIANARAYEQERKRADIAAAQSAALAELDQAKTAFFSNVSHEFRTPLTLLLGPIEEMLANSEEVLSVHQREQLETLHRNTLRLLKLVNTLLDFSRIEADRAQAVYEPTALSIFTAELASVFRSTIEKAGLRLIVECPPLPELVYVDQDMWEKIVLNLLSNAFKFTFEGEIRISLHWTGESVTLEVQDTGTGIPSEELPYLFKRFHRIRGACARTHEGTGIGLALVQELVRLHGGTVEVTSVLNQGTTFSVKIPTGSAHLPSQRIRSPGTEVSTALGSAPYIEEALSWLPEEELNVKSWEDHLQPSNSPRLLLVDDNADMRNYVKRLLESRYEVEAVADGLAALAAVRDRLPDLVLSDVMMPGLDGVELLRSLRANPDTREIPIILLSARAGEESRIEGLEAGADDYLIKPFSANELLARVSANLNQARMRQDATRREQTARAEAEAAQHQVSQILERITDGFASFDNQWYYTYVNQEAARLVQKKPEELIGKNVWEEFPEAVGSRFYQEYQRALAEQVSIEFEEFYPPLNIWFQIRIYPSCAGISVYYRDVTKRKQVEEQLWETNQTFNSLFQACPLGITVFSLEDGRVKLWNPAAEKIFGWSEQEALGRLLPSVPEGKKDEFLVNLNTIKQGEELRGVELRRQKKDGSPIDIAVWATTMGDAKGEVNCISILADISDRKRLEEELRSALMKLTFHVENSPMGVVEWDQEFRVIRWSKQAEKLFGWQASEVLGKQPNDWPFVYGEDFETTQGIVERLGNGTEQQSISANRNYTKDGKVVYCEWYNSALCDESGKMMSVLSLVLDVTERKQVEAERDREATQRQRLLQLEQEARAQAEAANRIKDEFLAVLSHELRSPLNPILGWTNLLRTRRCDEKTTLRALEIIERNAKLQTQLIEDLLDVSRILRGKLSLNTSPVHLKSTIEAALETVHLAAQAKSIEITTIFEPNVGQVSGDSNRLQQVVWNLLSNAVKFTPSGGHVEVRLSVVKGLQVDKLNVEYWEDNSQPAQVTAVASAIEALEALAQVQPDLLLSDIGMPEVDGYMLMRQIRAMSPEQGGEIPAIALTAYAGDTDQKQVLAAGFQKHIAKPVEPADLVAAIANLV